MSNYIKSTDFASKDSLPSGDSAKIIKGAEFETEFDAIAVAVNSKADTAGPTFTGTVTIPTASVTTFNLGGTEVTATAAELNILDGVTATTAELNYVDGVTSSIQTQLDGKATSAQGATADSAMQDLVDDTTPQLGGDLDVNGYGIDFSGNPNASGMTSELLDDYEEGTFAPIFLGTTTAGTLTYSTQKGTYTKIGNVVHFAIEITASSFTVAPAGNLRIGGLPFTASASGYLGTANIAYAANFGVTNTPAGATIVPSNNQLILRKVSSADARDNLLGVVTTTGIGVAIQMQLSGHYYV